MKKQVSVHQVIELVLQLAKEVLNLNDTYALQHRSQLW